MIKMNVFHLRNSKEASNHELNHALILGKAHRVIELNQKDYLKPYIDMNNKLNQKAKTNFEKDFFKLINNAIFGKLQKM